MALTSSSTSCRPCRMVGEREGSRTAERSWKGVGGGGGGGGGVAGINKHGVSFSFIEHSFLP